MSIINSYDTSEEIVKAGILTKGQRRLPKIAIVCFKKELIDYIKDEEDYMEYSDLNVLGDSIKLYKTQRNGKDILIYRTLLGGSATVGMMEELHARGVDKFIVFGSCGELTSDLKNGAFVIPNEAYRDEGTSYHYLPESDFVKIKSYEKLVNIFEEEKIDYEITKVWTTDALYKETVNKVENRLKQGCKVVDMECASIMALAENRKFEAYQFLYKDDTLANNEWKIKSLQQNRFEILKVCLNIALKIADKI